VKLTDIITKQNNVSRSKITSTKVRFRSRNAYFFQVSPSFVTIITAFFFFFYLVSSPHSVSFVISRRKIRQDRKVGCNREREREKEGNRRGKGEILSFLFLIKLPRSLFSIFLLSLLIIGARYTLVYLQAMSVASTSRISFSSSVSKEIEIERERMRRENRLTGKKLRFACGLVSPL